MSSLHKENAELKRQLKAAERNAAGKPTRKSSKKSSKSVGITSTAKVKSSRRSSAKNSSSSSSSNKDAASSDVGATAKTAAPAKCQQKALKHPNRTNQPATPTTPTTPTSPTSPSPRQLNSPLGSPPHRSSRANSAESISSDLGR